MRIAQLIPGSGETFYCQNCVRDGGLTRAMSRRGEDALVVPLYLPLAQAGDTPIFFGGVNVFLQQKSALFRHTPRWLDRWLDSPRLLNWAARRSGMTSARILGETTLSMLRGAHGRQVKELRRLIDWLQRNHRPDVVVLSNALLAGMAREIRRRLGCRVVCLLEDEHEFLDNLVRPYRDQAWQAMTDCGADIDAFVAVSEYYAGWMSQRLALSAGRVRVMHTGLDWDGYAPADEAPAEPVIGFLSRQCADKGLDLLVEAFVRLAKDRPTLRLRVAGGMLPEDADFVREQQRRLAQAGLAARAEFLPNLDQAGRVQFMQTLSVLSVPVRKAEAFGLYIVEANACGVPVVQPRSGAHPEVLNLTGGGVVIEPENVDALANALAALLDDPKRSRQVGLAARDKAAAYFTIERMAETMMGLCHEISPGTGGP